MLCPHSQDRGWLPKTLHGAGCRLSEVGSRMEPGRGEGGLDKHTCGPDYIPPRRSCGCLTNHVDPLISNLSSVRVRNGHTVNSMGEFMDVNVSYKQGRLLHT